MTCSITGCNAKGDINLIFYCFYRKDRKPYDKEIIKMCESHAIKITSDDTNIRIQAMPQ